MRTKTYSRKRQSTLRAALRTSSCILALFFMASAELRAQAPASGYDILIRNAYVFDGSGADSARLDVGIIADRIAFVGTAPADAAAKKTIDGTGLYLAPGFIDPHTHYLSQLNGKTEKKRAVMRALAQGVTTVFVGNDGSSPLPVGKALNRWDETGIGPNAALFVGHNSIRRKVIGTRDVEANPEQLDSMENWVRRSMEEGAFGLSTGLFYTPGNFANTEEVVALAKVAASFGGIYDTHQRDEGSQGIGVANSTKEVLEIGELADIPVHFSHIKVAGPKVWGKSQEIIDLITDAQKRGIVVTANQYPYVASQTGLSSALVPAWVRDGGTSAMRERFKDESLKDSILNGIHQSIQARTADPYKLVLSTSDKNFNGKSLGEVADGWGISAEEAVMRICADASPSVHSFMMTEEDIENFMIQPWVMTGSDGGSRHPRAFGTFARKIREYAINRGVMSIAQAIYKSTYLTAQTLNVKERGLIKEGYYADLFLFDPETYRATSTYEDGEQLAEGVSYVLVNGKLSIAQGEPVDALNGKALRLNK